MISMVVGALTKVAELVVHVCTTLALPFRGDADVGTVSFPRRWQLTSFSCGSRSTQAIALHFGIDISHDEVMEGVLTTKEGTSMTPIVRFLRKQGLRAGYHRRMTYGQLERALARGAVVLVDIRGVHWSVVHAASDDHVWLANPSLRQLGRRITRAKFRSWWTGLGVVVSERPSQRRRRLAGRTSA